MTLSETLTLTLILALTLALSLTLTRMLVKCCDLVQDWHKSVGKENRMVRIRRILHAVFTDCYVRYLAACYEYDSYSYSTVI